MKNCDDMVRSLLSRREQYNKIQYKKRKMIAGAITSLCCVCLICVIGFTMGQENRHTAPDPNTNQEDTSVLENVTTENNDDSVSLDKIVTNPLEQKPSTRMYIALMRDDFVKMTLEEMVKYYGADIMPEVPQDMSLKDTRWGIYKRDNGQGEVYCDQNPFYFYNQEQTRALAVHVDKGILPHFDFLYYCGTEEKSVINQVEVYIGITDFGEYYAEFFNSGVGYRVFAAGLSEQEFVSVLSSLTD